MSDTYQAVYDATRSRIGSCDVAGVVGDVARAAFDMSHTQQLIQQEFMVAAGELMRPSAVWRPTVAPDGNKWCALYGPNLMEGVSGFGDTPDEAMRDFDKNWREQRCGVAR